MRVKLGCMGKGNAQPIDESRDEKWAHKNKKEEESC